VAIGQIARESEGDVVVVTLRGEHDLSTAAAVRDELDQAVSAGAAVVVDMTETAFIDSSILGVLVASYRGLTTDGASSRGFAVAAAPGGPVTRLLDLVAVSDLVEVYPTRAAAVAAVTGELVDE
jgi:anti-anti-sigma factor